MKHRANPARTLAAILNSDNHAAALDCLTKALMATWESGHRAGFHDGVSDANDDNPGPQTPNPYATTERATT
jgi:hypothetical protein